MATPKGEARLEQLAEYLKVISDPNRLRILCMLAGGERCVCEICDPLDLRQNLASHHLKALKDAGLVKSRRDGKWMRYSLDVDKVLQMTDLYAEVVLGGS